MDRLWHVQMANTNPNNSTTAFVNKTGVDQPYTKIMLLAILTLMAG